MADDLVYTCGLFVAYCQDRADYLVVRLFRETLELARLTDRYVVEGLDDETANTLLRRVFALDRLLQAIGDEELDEACEVLVDGPLEVLRSVGDILRAYHRAAAVPE